MLCLGLFAVAPLSDAPMPLLILNSPVILYFIAGIGLALLREWLVRSRELPKIVFGPLVASSLLVAIFVALENVAFLYVWEPLFVLLVALVAMLCEDAGSGALSDRIVDFLGIVSYSLYLSHAIILTMWGELWRRTFGASLLTEYYWFGMIVCIGVAVATYYAVERPLTNFSRKIFAR